SDVNWLAVGVGAVREPEIALNYRWLEAKSAKKRYAGNPR
ncbi:MAG: hypothetical protein RLZZ535_2865, partial [Cyanobacteriota bacterium]